MSTDVFARFCWDHWLLFSMSIPSIQESAYRISASYFPLNPIYCSREYISCNDRLRKYPLCRNKAVFINEFLFLSYVDELPLTGLNVDHFLHSFHFISFLSCSALFAALRDTWENVAGKHWKLRLLLCEFAFNLSSNQRVDHHCLEFFFFFCIWIPMQSLRKDSHSYGKMDSSACFIQSSDIQRNAFGRLCNTSWKNSTSAFYLHCTF